MTHLTTHVLDAASGQPARGVAVVLTGPDGIVATGETDADGRLALGPDRLEPGEYALTFDTGAYFAAQAVTSFHPRVTVAFAVGDEPHLHVPLLLSPFAYTTYRGS
ncbi:hydroxyisourate hydrolase [Microbacterium sp. 10M-3C3]|jgi:5-hydroxyisourate hydrolase|uniref:hydroxyisourate hydrolase n=1 Tax=Microbacterium sp. 10M-3C3 TaxID=2483401 RepID=UPI000F6383DE|nr:hydroxyisourate hydrolase [Microbacterium sp. 10M-3C3]